MILIYYTINLKPRSLRDELIQVRVIFKMFYDLWDDKSVGYFRNIKFYPETYKIIRTQSHVKKN